MQLPKPDSENFIVLVSNIESGQVKIPQFQRDFVWSVAKAAELMDSIIKGYPIGTFIFWKTKERLRSVRDLGGIELRGPKKGDFVNYVLDGQQRLTSLFACFKGAEVSRADSNKVDDFSKIYVDLDASEDEQIVITDISEKADMSYISILDLLGGDFVVLAQYPCHYRDKLKSYQNRIESYQYPIISISDAPIDVATEIFTRINVGGKQLTLFEIMVAKTFDADKDFDLSEKYGELIAELQTRDYETIPDSAVLQAVAIIISGECSRKVILKIDKEQFIDAWGTATDAIKTAVGYFRDVYRIPVSKLLPYPALIVPFAYFFAKNAKSKRHPAGEQKKYLQDFFWRCSLGNRYSNAVASKLAQDAKRIDKIISEELPSYDWAIDSSVEFITDNGWFSTGRSYIKAILCILSFLQPRSFGDYDHIVNVSNDWLHRSDSKNYHHFFPKAYLKKVHQEDWANHIANITIVDDHLNKREIGAKPPSSYMKQFSKNEKLVDTMKTHLIGDLHDFGVLENNYDLFFDKRLLQISKEIKKRIIKQGVDESQQENIIDDEVES